MTVDNAQWRLGLGGSDHDFSAALARGNDVRIVVEQERLTRIKNGLSAWYREPITPAIDHCLKSECVTREQITEIVASDTIPARTRAAFSKWPLRLYSHHLCHAASAYIMMPVGSKAAIIVYDGYGSIAGERLPNPEQVRRETISFYRFTKEGPRCLGMTCGAAYREQDDFPIAISNSVGMLYELATCALGYGPMDSGKTMGLAAHGMPRFTRALEQFITLNDDLSDCFRCPTDKPEIVDVMEHILKAGRGSFSVRADLAASVQEIVHAVLLHCIKTMKPSDVDCIGISGGCGLNSVANSRLAEELAPDMPLVIPPHCGDAGLGLGALWIAAYEDHGRSPRMLFRGNEAAPGLSRPGRRYSTEEINEAVAAAYPRLVLDPSVVSPADIAAELANGLVVGVFNGPSELGPRALGGRSILADPRSVSTRERINRVLKRREPFRPLGPVVLASDYGDYFYDPRHADAYMLKVARARERCLREAPAVIHIDGSARVQVVGNDGDRWLIDVLAAFKSLTGIAVLINTSFNRRGEPIVETPEDAIDVFLGIGLDALYLDGRFYRPVST
jgi:carbamoyltransferase